MRKNIKLIICLFVMIFVLAGMTGCGSKSESAKREEESKSGSAKDKDGDDDKDIDDGEDDDKDIDDGKDDDKDIDDGKDDDKDIDDGKDDDKDIDDGKDDDEKIQSDISDWEEYYGLGYSLKLSSAWKEMEYEAAELAFVHSSTAGDGFAENINVMTQDTSAYDMDLESYLDLSLQQYDTLGYDVIDYKHMTVNGVKGYYCVTSTEVQSVTCYISQYFTIIDDTAYIFTFAADSDGFYELEDEVKDIYRTIEFY